MKMVKYYLIAAVIYVAIGLWSPLYLVQIGFLWIGLSLIAVSAAYVLNKPNIFRKGVGGRIPIGIRWIFYPFLLGVGAYNSYARRYDKVPPIQKIDNDIFLACRLFPKDVDYLSEHGVTGILDVTAEFNGLDWSADNADLAYFNIPVLDHMPPKREDLLVAIKWIDEQVRNQGKVVIHCALGRGRSVFVTAAYLLSRDDTLTIEQVMNKIQSIRKTARLNTKQLEALTKIKSEGVLASHKKLALIANPVSGGGKWPNEKDGIIKRLEAHYELIIKETTPTISAKTLTREAVKMGCNVIVACGGDGTVGEVADVLAGSDMSLGILPLGTANALSMILLGSGSKLSPMSSACDAIISGHIHTIDTAVCNQKRVLLLCAVGVEADMIKRSDREEKNRKGQLAYIQYFFESLTQAEQRTYQVTLDNDAERVIETRSLVIANAAPASTVLAQGGGNPNPRDGLLDISWFSEDTTSMSAVAGLTTNGLLDGKFEEHIEHTQRQSIEIKANNEFDYVIDGEVYQAKALSVKCEPGSLRIIGADHVLNYDQIRPAEVS